MGEEDFNHFMRLRNQVAIEAENFAEEENLSPVLIPKLFKDLDEQLNLAQNEVDVVDRANKKNCVTPLRYSVNQPESSYAQIQFFASMKEDGKFQQNVYVKKKLEEFIYLLDVTNPV